MVGTREEFRAHSAVVGTREESEPIQQWLEQGKSQGPFSSGWNKGRVRAHSAVVGTREEFRAHSAVVETR